MNTTRNKLPGFGLTLGYTISYLCLIVLIPLSAAFINAASMSIDQWIDIIGDKRTLASLRLSFGTAFCAAIVNTLGGVLVAWVLNRYRFPGRRLADALIDLPFALPTAVAGIALTSVYAANGWLGEALSHVGVKVAFTPLGITIALVFVGLPFVVRTVQPILEQMDTDLEEAAASLGAGRLHTLRRVIFPLLLPATLTGFTLSFARGIGEYGSVVFISGNMPFKTEIAPLLIVTKLEQYDYAGATAIAVLMLVLSFLLLFGINLLQRWTSRNIGHEN